MWWARWDSNPRPGEISPVSFPFFVVSLGQLIRNEFAQRYECYVDLEPYFSQLTISSTLFLFLESGVSSDTLRGVNAITEGL